MLLAEVASIASTARHHRKILDDAVVLILKRISDDLITMELYRYGYTFKRHDFFLLMMFALVFTFSCSPKCARIRALAQLAIQGRLVLSGKYHYFGMAKPRTCKHPNVWT